MSIHQLNQNNQPFENYKLAIAGISDLAQVTADVRKHVQSNWRELELEFGGKTYSSSFDGLNLHLKLKLGLISKGSMDCQVEIGILGHGYSFNLNTAGIAGFSTQLLQPDLTPNYQHYLKTYYPQQLHDGFGFMYQYDQLNSDNALVDFWQQIGKSIAAEVVQEINLHQADNPLNPVTQEVIRLTVCLCLTTVMTNYFFNSGGHGEIGAREAYIHSQMGLSGQHVSGADAFNTLDLAYIREAKRFAYKATPIDYKGSHVALTQNRLLQGTNLGRMYDTYLHTVPGISVNPHTNEVIAPPRIEQAVIHNYNPAVLLSLMENLWGRMETNPQWRGAAFDAKVQYIVESVLGYQEMVGFQNMLLSDPKVNPIAMDINNTDVRNMFAESMRRYLQGFKY